MMPAGRWVLTSGQWRLHLSHHHLLPLLMPVSQCLLPLPPALMPHLTTLLPPTVSSPPHTTDASGTVPPSSALRACVSVTLTPHPQQVLLSIFYLTTGRKKLMTTATMVNDEKK